MPDAAPEIVYTGAAKPPSWGERLIRAHTPEAHYQDIMKKYFWVTDRLEGSSLELAQRIRPAVELYAKAAGWSQTITELYLAGSAVAITAILAGKGIKTAAEVFANLARKHGSGMGKKPKETGFVLVDYTGPVRAKRSDRRPGGKLQRPPSAANLLGPGEQYARPSHMHSNARFAGFSAVTARNRDDGRKPRPPSPAKPRPPDAPHPLPLVDPRQIARHEVMRTVGVQAAQFGGYLKEHLRDLPNEQRRHAQRAFARILQGLLSDNGTGPRHIDPKQAFLDALSGTKPKSGGLKTEHTDSVLAALREFSAKREAP